ncbi:MAG: adenylate/guanylate cyclase domain-containing protein [Verrucomicrobiota bacterium]
MTTTSASKPCILLVDDMPEQLFLLRECFNVADIEVLVAESGESALRQMKSILPDLILLDLLMPGIDGYEMLTRLKNDPKTKEIPVILLTGVTDTSEKINCFKMGAIDYITKPFQQGEVVARVNIHLGLRRLQQQLEYQNKKLEAEIKARLQTEEALRAEQTRSESLLNNIMPQPIAARLREKHDIIADKYEDVTVLFADIVDFSSVSAHMSPQDLVTWLDKIFTTFDRLVDENGLEKIKTIGDAYVAAGGMLLPRPDHAEAVARLALAMQTAIAEHRPPHAPTLRLRIGIHTGPVVAGVIGKTKFAYDLWGDTVNLASRMESHGREGEIQISAATYERICDQFLFEKREGVSIKGKGDMTVYILKGLLSAVTA